MKSFERTDLFEIELGLFLEKDGRVVHIVRCFQMDITEQIHEDFISIRIGVGNLWRFTYTGEEIIISEANYSYLEHSISKCTDSVLRINPRLSVNWIKAPSCVWVCLNDKCWDTRAHPELTSEKWVKFSDYKSPKVSY